MGKNKGVKFKVDLDDNKRYISTAINIANLPKIDTNDPKKVKLRCDEYFLICANKGGKPTFAGLALALGVNRRTLWSWLTGYRGKPKEVVDVLSKYSAVLNSLMEDYMMNDGINVVSGIFLMKNNYGYRDQTEITVAPANPLGDLNRDELEARYMASIPDAESKTIPDVIVDQIPEKSEHE